jgi:hypothetical protein
MANLSDTARSAAGDAIYGMDKLDIEEFREKLRDQCASAAESACTYSGDCADILSRYENEREAADAEEYASGAEWKAADWREARDAWAFAVAYAVLSAKAEEIGKEVEEAADNLSEAASNFGADDMGEPRVSLSCPHGWAVHRREDEAGVHFWYPAELEGCRAVAVDAGPFWLSYTWTPEPANNEEEEA